MKKLYIGVILLAAGSILSFLLSHTKVERKGTGSGVEIPASEARNTKVSERPASLPPKQTGGPGEAAGGEGVPQGETPNPAIPAPDGSLPQGAPVLAVSNTQTLGDPREAGGAIIPQRNPNSFVPGLMATATITVGKKSQTLTPTQRGVFPTMATTSRTPSPIPSA